MRRADEFPCHAARRVAPRIHRASPVHPACVSPRTHSVRRPRLGNRPKRRRPPGRKRRGHQPDAHEPHSRDRLAQRPCRGRTRRRQSRYHRARLGAGIFLRPRPFVAIGLQHWRQRRGKFRRRPLPEVWVHHHARPGARSCASRRDARASRRQSAGRSRL